MMARLYFLLLALPAAAMLAILWLQSPSLSLAELIPTTSNNVTNPPKAAPISFQEVSLDWQVVADHRQSSEKLSSLTETLGSGICTLDVNQDGWMDLFVVGGSGHTRHYGKQSWWHNFSGNRLLLNRRGDHFEDITESAGLTLPIWGMGCAVADFDNDGLPDLFVTGVGKNIMFKNIGNAKFENVSGTSGMGYNQWTTGASLADFDADGLIDIYVSNYIQYRKGSRTFERASGFLASLDVAFDQTLYDPAPNRLYRNLGNFRFEEIGQQTGTTNAEGRSLGARWVDINDDSWPDLIVNNDRGSPSQLFLNNEGKSFSRRPDKFAALEIDGVRDIVISDFDNDGTAEFFMSRGIGMPPVLLQKIVTDSRANQTYGDRAWPNALAQTRLLFISGWGSVAADFNNNGFLDLYRANGSTVPDADAEFVPQAQNNSLFVNDTNGSFVLQSPTTDDSYSYSSRGVISVDLDNDGQLELVVSNNNGPIHIFKNQAPAGHWIGLNFSSLSEARRYGASVTISTRLQSIHRTLHAPQTFLSQGDPRLHIGLGAAEQVLSLTIDWRDGQQSRFNNIAAGHYYHVTRDTIRLDRQSTPAVGGAKFVQAVSGFDEESLKNLFRLLMSSPPGYFNADDLMMIWEYAPTTTRLDILDNISQQWRSGTKTRQQITYIRIARKALADPDSEIRIKAIRQFRQAELEFSVAWLIPLLKDKDVDVQCAAAETFGFFFDEEEAVSHRKKLALAPLIRMLDGNSGVATICAANALSKAEHKRAILPLITVARHHQNSEVKAVAIRALGLIRDSKALPVVHELMQSSTNPAVTAACFIAMSRLDEPNLQMIFETHFLTPADEEESRQKYDTLSQLLLVPDGIVFSRLLLIDTLQRLIEQSASSTPLNSNSPGLAAISAMSNSRSPLFEAVLIGRINNRQSLYRAEALVALALLNTLNGRTQFNLLLSKQSPSITHRVVLALVDANYVFSSKTVANLFKDRDTTNLAMQILDRSPVSAASRLLDTLLEQPFRHIDLAALMNTCVANRLQPSPVDDSRWRVLTGNLQVKFIDCFLQSTSCQQIRRNLDMHRMLKAILDVASIDESTKSRLLVKASASNVIIAKTMLAPRFTSLPEKSLQPALQAIETLGATDVFEDTLWALYLNRQRPTHARLYAARLLLDFSYQNNRAQESTLDPENETTKKILRLLVEEFAGQLAASR